MRDDIHRRLPLPRAWKRVVKACSREAEADFRPSLVAQAAVGELRQLRPTVVDEARRALADREASLFPGEVFQPACTASTAIEGDFLRECRAIADSRLPSDEATAQALARALRDRIGAVQREVRAQVSIDSPRDCAELVARFGEAARAADVQALARRHLAGESPPRPERLGLDLDADLRGPRER